MNEKSRSDDCVDDTFKRRVAQRLDQLISTHQIPGIQHVVVNASSILFNYAGGVRDVQTQAKVTPKTRFLSSSCTKVVTATAILKLVEVGKISSLDDSLSDYFDQHPYGEKVLIRHLLNQSSGLPNPMPLHWFHTAEEHHTSYSETEELNQVFHDNPKLDFEPGQKYAYSNLSYWLLGKVIEKVTGMSYNEYVRSQVLGQLGITKEELDCELLHDGGQDDHGGADYDQLDLARGHQRRFTLMTMIFWLLTPSKLWDESVGYWSRYKTLYMNGPAYGGLFGTAMGYAKFLQDMMKAKPILFSKATTKELFFSDQTDSSETLLPTTLGWHRGSLVSENDGDDNKTQRAYDYFGKPGGGPGFHSNLRIYPELGIATVVLVNTTEVSEGPIHALSDSLDMEFVIREASRAAIHQNDGSARILSRISCPSN